MKVLHVFDHSLPIQSGYAFRSAAILREQARLGWQTIQVTGPKHSENVSFIESVSETRYHRIPASGGWIARLPFGNQADVVLAIRRALRVLVRKEQPDIIHAHSPCLNALAAIGLGPPLVYEMRSSWEDAAVSTGTTTEGSPRYLASKALETFVLRRADAVTTICEGLRSEIIARGVDDERVTVVPNAVDAESFLPSNADSTQTRRALGLEDATVLGFVGSFFAWEGLGLLIEAMPLILAGRPNARLLLVGGGVHEPALRELTSRLCLQDKVLFVGPVPHDRIAELYDAIDLLVYPRMSMRLTDMVTPLKPLEAMALGKAQIASDVGGHLELIEDGRTGVLFRSGDVVSLAETALRILNDPMLAAAIRANGPIHVRKQRTWAHSVARYRRVYEALIGRAAS